MISSAKIASLLGLRLVLALIMPIASVNAIASPARSQPPGVNPAGGNQALTVRSDIQEADAKTGIVTARGNVRINYPSRQMQGTAAQAQYFSRERRIVLMGDAYVLQDGNSLRAETITYLIDEGRFIAVPENNQQVESVYFIPPASP
ncbi:MAG: OstA family protein [Oscillatoria sp. SIO1A7]|nr:OstA family protein [Oscillatoria sp. SIO1A7]